MKKIITSVIILIALLTVSTGTVFAQEATAITGVVQLVEFGTDPDTGEITFVIVTLDNGDGTTQTINLSLSDAEDPKYGLVDSSSGTPLVNTGLYGTEITIQPEDILPTEGEGEEEEAEHPVGSALSEFFGELLGVDYDTVMTAHEDGFGFGVIAQALWLANQYEDAEWTFTTLLEAKQSGDYSEITLADGSTPDNWGDVVRGLKKGENLGSVMSGHAETSTTTPTTESQNSETTNGNGHGNGNGNGNNGDSNDDESGNGNGNGQGNNGGQGNGNGNGKENGKGGGKGDGEGNGKGNGKGGGKP